MQTIGLIAAMAQESDALLRCIPEWRRVGVGPYRAAGFVLGEQTCVLVTCGMGYRRAGQAARILTEVTASQILISFGIAGAVEADLQVGDVLAVEAVCRLEQGVPGPRLPLAAWPDAARELIAQALVGRGARLLTGTAITTVGSQGDGRQLAGMSHPLLEMETYAIARVAEESGIPLLSLRAISDGPCAPLPFDLGQVMDGDANLRPGELLKAVIRRPGILLQSGSLLRNTRIAAANAALALASALSQPIFRRLKNDYAR